MSSASFSSSTSSRSFSSSFESKVGMSLNQFSPGLSQVAFGLSTGTLAKDFLAGALAAAGPGVSFGGAAGVSGSGTASIGGFGGSTSISATGSASFTVAVPRTIQEKVQIPVSRQVPDMANAGRLEASGNSVTTPGGYKVRMEGDTAFITAPNGKQVKVWGDPHIESSDGKGGTQNIDFRKGTTSFVLPDGTNITMNAYKDGKVAANGQLGKLDITNGNKHVTLSNGREQTGQTGAVTTSGVKNDGFATSATQDRGDVLHVVGDGSQLAYQGKLTQGEAVSGTTRQGDWATGAVAGQATVGAKALEVPTKTIQGFEEITRSKTVWENQTFSASYGVNATANTWTAAAMSSVGASASANVSGNGFAVNGGFGGFGTGHFGDFSLSSVGGAFGGAGLYGHFDSHMSSHRGNIAQSQNFSASWNSSGGFPFQAVGSYISSATGGAASVFNTYNASLTMLNQSRYRF